MSLSRLEIQEIADVVAERIIAHLATKKEDDILMDVHAAAALLSCSVPTVERLTKKGVLPSVKVASLRRYRRSKLLELREQSQEDNDGNS